MTSTINGHSIELLHGDALKVLPAMRRTFSAVITDPPYSSGAGSLAGKQQSTARKYTATKDRCPYPDFEGDSLDQRSWARWVTEWLRDARALCEPGAPLCVFSDWRQLPALTDAVQWSGWTWRGVAVWDKVTSRPQRGRFRQQAEFVTWASNGPMPVDRNAGVLPGVLTYVQENGPERVHQTQKPLDLMRQIVRITEPGGGAILDPFAGSGTTLLAAALEGYDAVGIESCPRATTRPRWSGWKRQGGIRMVLPVAKAKLKKVLKEMDCANEQGGVESKQQKIRSLAKLFVCISRGSQLMIF